MWFRSRSMVGEDLGDWIADSFRWHRERHPESRPLVLPTSAFIRASRGEDQQTALAVLADLKRLLNMEHRQIEIAPLPDIPDEIAQTYEDLSEVAGTYEFDPETPLIRYNPKSLRRPIGFINTLVHELMHDKLVTDIDAIPGGEGAHELATDLHCILWGFGLFQLQAADDVGWTGYLSQPSRAYALELFLSLRGDPTDRENLAAHSSARVQRLMKRAARDPRREIDIEYIASD